MSERERIDLTRLTRGLSRLEPHLPYVGCKVTGEELQALTTAVYALDSLLDVAERTRAGDPSLDPEEWYASRDCARIALSRFDISLAGSVVGGSGEETNA
jgi:hypothetical protein